jgi:anaerobic magnesium-protoporphyrin IX monomethyl ester cyclase
MFSMKKSSLELAQLFKDDCDLLVVGGPLPTLAPADFLDTFDVAAIGEGEETLVELVKCVEKGEDFSNVKGVAYKDRGKIRFTPARNFVQNLDDLPFPSRELFDNEAYKKYYSKRFGYTITSLITSRGCPFSCDFCSRPVFGTSFRTRSPSNIADEVGSIVSFGYDRVWFADDCFTLNRAHLISVCDEMIRGGIDVGWECLSRADTVDREAARRMRQAGCVRVFFGIESGNNDVLTLMRKQITSRREKRFTLLRMRGCRWARFLLLVILVRVMGRFWTRCVLLLDCPWITCLSRCLILFLVRRCLNV